MNGVLPAPRDSHSCTTVGDNLFVFGGTDGRSPLGDLQILDTCALFLPFLLISILVFYSKIVFMLSLVSGKIIVFSYVLRTPYCNCVLLLKIALYWDTQTRLWFLSNFHYLVRYSAPVG